VREVAAFDTADGLYDCCWSEVNENILVSASGDGSVKVWDLSAPPAANPLRSLEEHSHEVYCVAWSLGGGRDTFLSASWDDTAKLWSLGQGGAPRSLRTFAEHAYCVYAAAWNPRAADVFATASGDCTLKVWDARAPFSTLTLPAHGYEVLSCDWNKYNDCVLATGSVDKTARTWDLRNTAAPLATLAGHGYAVRRVRWSPFSETVLYTASYDMAVCAWDTGAPGAPLARRWEHHSEFAVGLDASPLVQGLIASTGWDEMSFVWSDQQQDART